MFVKGYEAASKPKITCYYDDFIITDNTTNPATNDRIEGGVEVEVYKKKVVFKNKNDGTDIYIKDSVTQGTIADWIKENFKNDDGNWECPYLYFGINSQAAQLAYNKSVNIVTSYTYNGNLAGAVGTMYQNIPNDKKESVKQSTNNEKTESNSSSNTNDNKSENNNSSTTNNPNDNSSSTNDTIIHNCIKGSYYRYYYKNGSYKGMKFPGDLSFNFVKYLSGDLILQVNYNGTVYSSNKLTSHSQLISPALQVDSFTFDLGNLNYFNECPDPSDLYFCYSKSSNNYMITLDKTQCSESDSAVQMVSKEVADGSDSSGTKDRKTSAGGWCRELIGLWTLLGYIKNIAYIFVPVLLIIMGSVTLLKAIISQKEDALKTAQKQLTNKIIAAVAVFLVVTVVNIAIGIVGDEGWKDCAACFIKPTSSECKISRSS